MSRPRKVVVRMENGLEFLSLRRGRLNDDHYFASAGPNDFINVLETLVLDIGDPTSHHFILETGNLVGEDILLGEDMHPGVAHCRPIEVLLGTRHVAFLPLSDFFTWIHDQSINFNTI